MTRPDSPMTEPPPAVAVAASSDDWGGLSRRIARRTTDLIVISLILVAGLTVARRLLVWWKTNPEDSRADSQVLFSGNALAPWGIGPGGAALELGELPLTLHRELRTGTREEALAQLISNCTATLAAADDATLAALPLPTEAESRLLRQLEQHIPATSDPQRRWELHELAIPLAMVLGVRFDGSADSPSQHETTPDGQPGLAAGDPPGRPARVVCWGLVLPLDANTWSILRVTPRFTGAASSGVSTWTLPEGVERGLSVSDAVGGSLVTFRGSGPPHLWRIHFEQLGTACGWQPVTDWQILPAAWSAGWRLVEGETPRRVDVQFNRDEAGWSGLLNVSPTRTLPSNVLDNP